MAITDPSQAYIDEAQELLADLEDLLLRLDQNPADAECIAGIFRTMHTIKGSGAMFGYTEIARFTHDIETVFDKVRSREIQANRELISLTFKAKDHLLELLRQDPAGEPGSIAASDAIILAFKPFLGQPQTVPPSQGPPVPPEEAAPQGTAPCPAATCPPAQAELLWLRYQPAPTAFLSGAQPLLLLEEVCALGKVRLLCHDEALPDLATLDPETVYCWWDVLVLSPCGANPLRDVFIFEDEQVAQIHSIGPGTVRDTDLDAFAHALGAAWRQPPVEIQTTLEAMHANVLNLRDAARAASAVPAAPQAGQAGQAGPARQDASHSGIRVDSGRLDHLVNMVGELVS